MGPFGRSLQAIGAPPGEILFVSADQRAAATAANAAMPGLYAVDTQGQERLVLLAKEIPMPAAPACGRVNAPVAFSSASGLYVAGQPATKKEDVFPFRPQWIRRNEILYTANGHIKRRSTFTDSASDIPFRASVRLQRTTYTIAHRLPVLRRVECRRDESAPEDFLPKIREHLHKWPWVVRNQNTAEEEAGPVATEIEVASFVKEQI